jgi:chondroitin AC lyase
LTANSFGQGIRAEDRGIIEERLKAQVRRATSLKDLSKVPQFFRSLGPDGSWSSIDYRDRTRSEWKALEHLRRTTLLAVASNDAADGQKLRSAAIKALTYWIENDFVNPNWFHNEIAVPRRIAETMLFIGSDLKADLRRSALKIIERAKKRIRSGANRVWLARNGVLLGVLAEDDALVLDSFVGAYEELQRQPSGREGIQPDLSFHQHGPVLYSGGYGQSFAAEIAALLEASNGTTFDADTSQTRLFIDFLLDGTSWMVVGRIPDYEILGREITRRGRTAAALARSAEIAAQSTSYRSDELVAMAASMQADSAVSAPFGNRFFWRSDFMVHRWPKFYASVRMFSTRTSNTDDFINGEGKQSHHLADGAMCLMSTGREYKEVFPVWDWRKVPGTTVEQSREPMDPKKVREKGATSFVGGVSDGVSGLAAMHLRRGALEARKAWVFFEDVVICLGTGISSTSDFDVLTTIDQSRLSGKVQVDGAGRALSEGESGTWHTRSVTHGAFHYVFPVPTEVMVSAQERSGSWSLIGVGSEEEIRLPVFTLTMSHGQHPFGASYVYAVTQRRGNENRGEDLFERFTVIRNDTHAQAVTARGGRTVAAAFLQPGVLEYRRGRSIAVDTPCLVLLQESGDTLSLTVSDPTQLERRLAFLIPERVAGDDAEDLGDGTTRVTMQLPDGPFAGSSIKKILLRIR